MNEVVAIFAGIGLAAACGFRVFLPLFVASFAANTGMQADFLGGFNISEVLGQHHWLGSTPVTVALGVATALEVGSYYIPWLDNALDSIATPAAVLAGAFITGEMMPDFMGDGAWRFDGDDRWRGESGGVDRRARRLDPDGGLGGPAADRGRDLRADSDVFCHPHVHSLFQAPRGEEALGPGGAGTGDWRTAAAACGGY